jgi:Phosphotransferase system mannitol/fructose-specific IIA domain (Ntr-type)
MNILDFLVPNSIVLHYEACDSRDVITHLGRLLVEAGYVRETFVDAALDRESRLPTGLPLSGDVNAAIPHTEVEHVLKPGLAMATLSAPVIFQNMVAPDEAVLCQLVFVMALDQPKAQIEMLQEIAGILQNPTAINSLMSAKDFEEVRAAFSNDRS